MTIEEMEKKRQDRGYTYRQISDGSGVALGTVQKIFGGSTSSPRYDTVQKLERFFVSEPSRYGTGRADAPSPVYAKYARKDIPNQGSYTVDDYISWPEDERIELIDGVIYDMAAPRNTHQVVTLEIAVQIRTQIRNKNGECLPMISPVDVQLDKDNRTMVQPDFLIVCDKSKVSSDKRVYGAPDFIVEILSPSTKMKDVFIKQNKYMNSGVREYWTVDINERVVTVYQFSEGRVVQHNMDGVVPIGIYDGGIVVDFGDIISYVSSFFGDNLLIDG
ncbi:MAG: Uma2 family endonuclease [Eubacterium sp.]|nr:Uma2 family endonuclease [Eubacterium sp.]